jgi:hypothetical protein
MDIWPARTEGNLTTVFARTVGNLTNFPPKSQIPGDSSGGEMIAVEIDMGCLCKYRNSVTNLFTPAFQQLKSIRSQICYPLALENLGYRYLKHNNYLAFLKRN